MRRIVMAAIVTALAIAATACGDNPTAPSKIGRPVAGSPLGAATTEEIIIEQGD